MDGEWHECLEPELVTAVAEKRACFIDRYADPPKQLFCRAHAQEFNRLKGRNSIKVVTEDGEELQVDERANPLLLYCRRQIELAVEDGKAIDQYGLPTGEAVEARAWIEDQPDWRDKQDFVGTFEWCCHWLGLEVERARNEALREINKSAGWQRGSKARLTIEARERMMFRRREECQAQLAMF